MDKAIESVGKPLVKFADDSVKLLRKCNKPDRKGTFKLMLYADYLFIRTIDIISSINVLIARVSIN